MNNLEELQRPTKLEQKAAMKSYDALSAMLDQLDTTHPEIEITENDY